MKEEQIRKGRLLSRIRLMLFHNQASVGRMMGRECLISIHSLPLCSTIKCLPLQLSNNRSGDGCKGAKHPTLRGTIQSKYWETWFEHKPVNPGWPTPCFVQLSISGRRKEKNVGFSGDVFCLTSHVNEILCDAHENSSSLIVSTNKSIKRDHACLIVQIG